MRDSRKNPDVNERKKMIAPMKKTATVRERGRNFSCKTRGFFP